MPTKKAYWRNVEKSRKWSRESVKRWKAKMNEKIRLGIVTPPPWWNKNRPAKLMISPATRFAVLKRDDFACTYCGNRPPDTILEIDHILPVSAGGKTVIDNLTTACFECNRGKSSNKLGS